MFYNLSKINKKQSFEEKIIIESDETLNFNELKKYIVGDNVVGVVVDYEFKLSDCSFLHFFPKVKGLVLRGKNIDSLKGLELLNTLNDLYIHLDNYKEIDLSAIRGKCFKHFGIDFVDNTLKSQLEKINNIENLKLSKLKDGDLKFLNKFKFNNLMIFNSNFESIEYLDKLNINKLIISNCRKLSLIDNVELLNIQSIEIDSCKSIDYEKLSNIKECRRLVIRSGVYNSVDEINSILNINKLSEVVIVGAKFKIDIEKLLPSETITSIYISLPQRDIKILKRKFEKISWN